MGVLGFAWYAFENMSHSSEVQNVSKGTSRGVPTSESQGQQKEKGANAEMKDSSAEPDSAESSTSMSDEESFEKAQSVSADTSLDAIDKELNQTDLGE